MSYTFASMPSFSVFRVKSFGYLHQHLAPTVF
jgi:hypothetical protein